MKLSRFIATSIGVLILAAPAASAYAAPQLQPQCAFATKDPSVNMRVDVYTPADPAMVQEAGALCTELGAGDDFVNVSRNTSWADQRGFDPICGAEMDTDFVVIFSAVHDEPKSVAYAAAFCNGFKDKGHHVVFADDYQSYAK